MYFAGSTFCIVCMASVNLVVTEGSNVQMAKLQKMANRRHQTLGTKNTVRMPDECYMLCHMDVQCTSVSYNNQYNECWISSEYVSDSALMDNIGWTVVKKHNQLSKLYTHSDPALFICLKP